MCPDIIIGKPVKGRAGPTQIWHDVYTHAYQYVSERQRPLDRQETTISQKRGQLCRRQRPGDRRNNSITGGTASITGGTASITGGITASRRRGQHCRHHPMAHDIARIRDVHRRRSGRATRLCQPSRRWPNGEVSNLAVMGDVNVQNDLDRISTRRHRSDVLAPLATKSKLSQAIKLDDARRGDLATWETEAYFGNQSFENYLSQNGYGPARHLKERTLQILGRAGNLRGRPDRPDQVDSRKFTRLLRGSSQEVVCLGSSCRKPSGQGNRRRARKGP